MIKNICIIQNKKATFRISELKMKEDLRRASKKELCAHWLDLKWVGVPWTTVAEDRSGYAWKMTTERESPIESQETSV